MAGNSVPRSALVPWTVAPLANAKPLSARMALVNTALMYAASQCSPNERPLYTAIRNAQRLTLNLHASSCQTLLPLDQSLPWESEVGGL